MKRLYKSSVLLGFLLLFASPAFPQMYIDKDVQVIDQVTGQKRSACLADESHCAIIISYSGQTREMVEVAEIYHKRNIPFISITCMAENWRMFICIFLQEKCYILK